MLLAQGSERNFIGSLNIILTICGATKSCEMIRGPYELLLKESSKSFSIDLLILQVFSARIESFVLEFVNV